MGAGEYSSNLDTYSTLNSLPFELSDDHIPTSISPQNLNGAYHTDLQQNFSAYQWNNRVDDSYPNYANSSPLSSPRTPVATNRQWSRLRAPTSVFQSGQDWNYGSQIGVNFLTGRSGWANGINHYRFIGGNVINDTLLDRYWPNHYYNRISGNGPFSVSATGIVALMNIPGLIDFQTNLPWFTTNVGGLPTMNKNRVNDAAPRAGLQDSYLVYYPAAATELSVVPDTAKGAGLQDGWVPHQWYETVGDPIYVKYREGDLLTRNGHNTVFTVSKSRQGGHEAVIM